MDNSMIVGAIYWMLLLWKTFRFSNHVPLGRLSKRGGWRMALNEYEGRIVSLTDAETFRRLAAEEGRHAAVFKNLTGQTLKPKKTLATLLPILYRLLGRKRLYPIIAKFEYGAADTYAPVAGNYPEVQSVKDDEKRHGDAVTELIG